ncbi:hypothetical protein BU16DRAFT_567205 [Lophium mytilinum]|uniref:Uncharacterized protein n=1 Tax=Lophium mytilinum TaxID=390894 RepID=A0A6A6QD98_9PEZI|nr:hypothetical protein BU16DRAFT_567205 [Lophium mytilinum]
MPDQQQPQLSAEDQKNAQDPNHPAHPEHPKHGEFLKSLPKKLGGAAVFGAGATMGGDAVKAALGQ